MVRKTCVILAGLAVFAASRASASTIIDLSTAAASSTQTAALGGSFTVTQISPQSTGTGVIDSFLRIHQTGEERGFNTNNGTPLDDVPGNFTRALDLSEIPIVNIGGIDYRQFLLDINQTGANPLLSLNQIQIFQSPTDPTSFILNEASATSDAIISGLGTEVFRMDNANNPNNYEIKLDFSLNSGSGSGDMFLYIRNSDFNPLLGNFVVLFSQFGAPPGQWSSNDGFEEWAVLKPSGNGSNNPQDAVPEPASLLLLGSGLAFAARRVHRKTKS